MLLLLVLLLFIIIMLIFELFTSLLLTRIIRFITGKNPQLTEFLQQIKSNPETAAIFQSIQQDSSRRKSTTTGDEPMEL